MDKLNHIIASGNVREDMGRFCGGQSWLWATTSSVVMAGFMEKVKANGISDSADIEAILFRAPNEDFRAFVEGTSAGYMVSTASDSELSSIRANIENSLQ